MAPDAVASGQNATFALQAEGICKRFAAVQALIDVNFNVRRGTVHALCGENGAGKSTLVKVLAGAIRPDHGSLRMHDCPVWFAAPAHAIQAGIATIYQELDLAPHLTAAENLFLGVEPRGVCPGLFQRAGLPAKARALGQRYGLLIQPEAPVASLSRGDCQIIEILRALQRQASLIVMDEPTAALAEREVKRLFEVIRQLRAQGVSIVYISHRLQEIQELADDITILRDGRKVLSTSVRELSIDQIIQHMVGRHIGDHYPKRYASSGDVRLKVEGLSAGESVSHVSFQLRKGEIAGMAGLVGAGRSALAEAIFGIRPLTSGAVFLDSHRLRIRSPRDAVIQGIALLTEDRQRSGLFLNLPAAWNITLPSLHRLAKRSLILPSREYSMADEWARRVRVRWISPRSPAAFLSGGNQQKLLIARWLLADSRVMLFDEPTKGIDVGARREIYELMQSIASAGTSILLISSDMDELFGVCERLLVMRRGRLVGDLATTATTPEEILRMAALE